MPLTRAEQAFWFKTQLSLVELTGLKASNLAELADHLERVPESSVYFHTHHFLQQHQYLTPEPPNDFAYWVTNVLQEDAIGERLAAIDTVRFNSLAALRSAILGTLRLYLGTRPALRQAPSGEEFHFMKSVRFNLPSSYQARDLAEFLDCLRKVSIHSLYNHVFEGRMRPPLGRNDFSDWLESALGEAELARKIQKLDPYTHTMEGLRTKMIHLIESRLEEYRHAAS